MARPLRPELTARQQEILDWIARFIRENGISPSMGEIAAAFGMAIPSATDAVRFLIRKGKLRRPERSRRSLQLVDRDEAMESCRAIPIIGEIAAGAPIDAYEQEMGMVYVERGILRGADGFALKVVGDSMVDAGILDGDVVVIRRQDTADDGDVVVALVNGAATLKRLKIDGARVELRPANRRMRPIKVAADDLIIQGKLVYVRRVM